MGHVTPEDLNKKLDRIERKLDKLEPPKPRRQGPVHRFNVENVQRVLSQEPSDDGASLLGRMDVELDWIKPSLHGKAHIVKSGSGRVTIAIVVEGEDAAIAEELIESQPVNALQLSSVRPR